MIARPFRAALLTSVAIGFLLGTAWPLPAQPQAEEPTFKVGRSESGALSLEVGLPSKLKLTDESWRLQFGSETLAVGTAAELARTDSPVQVSFPLDDKFSGQSLAGLKLLGGSEPIDLPPMQVPARLRVSVLLPAAGPWKAEELEFQTAYRSKIPVARIDGQLAELDLKSVTELDLGDTAGLRTKADNRRVTGTAENATSRLYPLLTGVLALALLVVTAFALPSKWRFWQAQADPRSAGGGSESPTDYRGQPGQEPTLTAALKVIQGSLDKIETNLAALLRSPASHSAADSPPSDSEPSPSDWTQKLRQTSGISGPRALAPITEQFWTTQGSLTELAEIARERGLQLFQWSDFQDSFQGSGIRTDEVRLQPWKAGAQGLVFLGWREGPNRPISLFPARLASFSTPEGRSVLQALFEFQPPRPSGSALDSLKPVKAAQVGVSGSHYKLDKRGVLGTISATFPGGKTDDDERAPYQPTAPSAGDHSSFDTAMDRLAEIATSLTSLQDKLSKLGEPRTDPALEAPVRLTESQFGELLRLFKAHVISDKVPSSPVAAAAQPPILDPTRDSLVAPSAPANATPDDAAARLRGIERLLAQPAMAGSSEGDYLLALQSLRDTARTMEPNLPSGQFFRLAMNNPDSASAIRIDLVGEPGTDLPRLLKPEGTYMTLEHAWQVFLGFEIDYLRLALVFPWSRLQKGAPTLARDLVDPVRSPSPLPEIVRCAQPLVLEHRPNDNAYAVVTKMIVAPIDATLLRGSS